MQHEILYAPDNTLLKLTFKAGESVVVTETTVIAGVTKIRRAGDTTEYWVYREAVPR